MANSLIDQVVRQGEAAVKSTDRKRKWDDRSGRSLGSQQQYKKQDTVKAYVVGAKTKKVYSGNKPLYSKCGYHHHGPCGNPCAKCKKQRHEAKDCRSTTPGSNYNHNNTAPN